MELFRRTVILVSLGLTISQFSWGMNTILKPIANRSFFTSYHRVALHINQHQKRFFCEVPPQALPGTKKALMISVNAGLAIKEHVPQNASTSESSVEVYKEKVDGASEVAWKKRARKRFSKLKKPIGETWKEFFLRTLAQTNADYLIINKKLPKDKGSKYLKRALFLGKYLSLIQLKKANCSGAKFQGSTLSYVSFSDVNLRMAEFQEAKLSFTGFYRSILYGANFQGANLRYTNFKASDLRMANFKGANFYYEYRDDLQGARIDGADFSDAHYYPVGPYNNWTKVTLLWLKSMGAVWDSHSPPITAKDSDDEKYKASYTLEDQLEPTTAPFSVMEVLDHARAFPSTYITKYLESQEGQDDINVLIDSINRSGMPPSGYGTNSAWNRSEPSANHNKSLIADYICRTYSDRHERNSKKEYSQQNSNNAVYTWRSSIPIDSNIDSYPTPPGEISFYKWQNLSNEARRAISSHYYGNAYR